MIRVANPTRPNPTSQWHHLSTNFELRVAMQNNTNNLSYWSVVSRMGGSSCTRPVVARVFFNNVYHIQNSRYRCIVSTLRSNPIGKEWQHLFGFWKTVVRSPLKVPSAFRLQIRSKRFLWASSEIASSPCCGISFSFGDWRALRFESSISKLWLRPTSCEFSTFNFSIWALKDSTSSPSPGHWPVPAWTGASLAAAGSWLSCGGTGYRKNWHLAGDFVKQVGQLYIYTRINIVTWTLNIGDQQVKILVQIF